MQDSAKRIALCCAAGRRCHEPRDRGGCSRNLVCWTSPRPTLTQGAIVLTRPSGPALQGRLRRRCRCRYNQNAGSIPILTHPKSGGSRSRLARGWPDRTRSRCRVVQSWRVLMAAKCHRPIPKPDRMVQSRPTGFERYGARPMQQVARLAQASMSPRSIRARIRGVSQKMLTQTLRGLERDGLVVRRVHPTVPVTVDYTLPALGL